MRSSVIWRVLFVLVTGFAVTLSAVAVEEDESSIARGGRLYDSWHKVIGERAPPEKHPAYPAGGRYATKPGTTWRCKECHGWDYKGKDGAYGKGSKHYTGIKGIRGAAGAATGKIITILKDKNHGYGGKLEAADLKDLANFVSKGQVDMDKYIDRATKKPKGNKAKGAAYYQTICATCHGKDGTEPDGMKKSLGGQMEDPWRVMHRILNAFPDEQMPALRALDRQVVADILAYLATLPKKK